MYKCIMCSRLMGNTCRPCFEKLYPNLENGDDNMFKKKQIIMASELADMLKPYMTVSAPDLELVVLEKMLTDFRKSRDALERGGARFYNEGMYDAYDEIIKTICDGIAKIRREVDAPKRLQEIEAALEQAYNDIKQQPPLNIIEQLLKQVRS